VALVSGGGNLALADAREVRLAGIEMPEVWGPNAADSVAQAALAAKKALATLVEDKDVLLKPAGPAPDCYGRLNAYIFVNDGSETSVQHALVAGGQAWVSARVGDKDCAAWLPAAERTARTAKLGLWREPYYEIRRANDLAGVMADRGRFALVEGKVVSVRESGGTSYMNFGRRWSEDFTVTILKRHERTFVAAGIEPKTLAERRIRVRGFIEERGGPWIEATAPEQIEVVAGN
jgi:endonuclease YncB( thermonuclease family)